jgi:hypothetical protein
MNKYILALALIVSGSMFAYVDESGEHHDDDTMVSEWLR